MKPDFLIVGAQKAGTTTLYRDLQLHPNVFLPEEKEPNVLSRLDDDDEIRARFEALFKPALPGQVRGEASTSYTKLPTYQGVPEKALRLLGPELKIIYITRDPIDRIVSHYQHSHHLHKIEEDFETALKVHRELLDFTRYSAQIAPWVEAFGAANVLQLKLEDYSAARDTNVRTVLEFLGLDPALQPPIDTETKFNSKADPRYIANPILRKFVFSSFYRNTLRIAMPHELRGKLRRLVLPKVKDDTVEVSPQTRAWIEEQLAQTPDWAKTVEIVA